MVARCVCSCLHRMSARMSTTIHRNSCGSFRRIPKGNLLKLPRLIRTDFTANRLSVVRLFVKSVLISSRIFQKPLYKGCPCTRDAEILVSLYKKSMSLSSGFHVPIQKINVPIFLGNFASFCVLILGPKFVYTICGSFLFHFQRRSMRHEADASAYTYNNYNTCLIYAPTYKTLQCTFF